MRGSIRMVRNTAREIVHIVNRQRTGWDYVKLRLWCACGWKRYIGADAAKRVITETVREHEGTKRGRKA